MLEGVEVDVARSERRVNRNVVAEGLHHDREPALGGHLGHLFGDLFRGARRHAQNDACLFLGRGFLFFAAAGEHRGSRGGREGDKEGSSLHK